jgi:hypothetical protein
MESDSAAFYGRRSGTIVEFIGQVKYRDSLVTMDANRGTYYRSGERWEARGNVVTENIQNGSRMVGPSLDYYRAIKGTRDTVEMVSVGRPDHHLPDGRFHRYPRRTVRDRGRPGADERE